MIQEDKVLVIDIDGTICNIKKTDQSYLELKPRHDMVEKIKAYKENGYYLIFHTSRNMKTYQGNIGKLNANTLKDLFSWMDQHNIPYDEIHVGKPWPGKTGFYIDDRAIRPNEFLNLSEKEIFNLFENET